MRNGKYKELFQSIRLDVRTTGERVSEDVELQHGMAALADQCRWVCFYRQTMVTIDFIIFSLCRQKNFPKHSIRAI